MEQYKDMYLEDVLSPSVRRHNFNICELEGMSPQKMPPPPPPPPHSGSQVKLTHQSQFDIFFFAVTQSGQARMTFCCPTEVLHFTF